MKLSQETVNRIRESARIVDVVGDFLPLRKTSVRYTTLCPFHEDRHDGNFVVYPAGNCYKCFACDAKGGPIDFLMNYLHMSYPDALVWLGNRYGIITNTNNNMHYTPVTPPTRQPLPMLILPWTMVEARSDTSNDTLCNWLRSVPWDKTQQSRVEDALAEYHVGHSQFGHTIFWEIDAQQQVRTGKMMKYKPDGHRDREAQYNFDQIHSTLFRDSRFPDYSDDKQEVKHCLFGLHLLNKYPSAIVCIVESEKTAVFMAICYGNDDKHVWMATGGEGNLSREKVLPIIEKERRINIFPDRDALDSWNRRKLQIGYDRMRVQTAAVVDWWKPEDGEKADIADVMLRMIREHSKPPKVTVADLERQNPNIQKLIKSLDLIEL